MGQVFNTSERAQMNRCFVGNEGSWIDYMCHVFHYNFIEIQTEILLIEYIY